MTIEDTYLDTLQEMDLENLLIEHRDIAWNMGYDFAKRPKGGDEGWRERRQMVEAEITKRFADERAKRFIEF